MSKLQFPKDPIVGQQYDFAPYKYYWDGTKWKTKGIGYNPVNELRDEVLPTTHEALRRSYAEAGLNLVNGSFEKGGALTSSSDVLLHKASGAAYSWSGAFPKAVSAGSTPTPLGSGGWIDKSEKMIAFAGLDAENIISANNEVSAKNIKAPSSIKLRPEEFISSTVGYSWPVELDGQGQSIVTVDAALTGAAFEVGEQLSVSDIFNRDYHKIKGLFITGGSSSPYGITFKPYNGHQSLIEDVTFMGFGNSAAWALNFQAQNWWPIVDKFSLSDLGEHVNGIKAIDDDVNAGQQGTGNSRLVVDKARIRYLNGREVDTTGVKVSATGTVIHASAVEGSGKGVQLCYPSVAAKIQNGYFEQSGALSGTKSIVLGDDSPKTNNFLFNISIKDIYSNLHNQGKFLAVGNTSTSFRDLVLDGINLANTNAEPVITPNDIAAQSMYVGYMTGNTSVLPAAAQSNPVHVVDTYNREWTVINGNGGSAKLGETIALPNDDGTSIADMWTFISNTSATYTRVVYDTVDRLKLRGATTGIKITPTAGSYSTLKLHIPDIGGHAGIDNTLQFFVRSSVATTRTVKISAWISSSSSFVLKTVTIDTATDWREVTIPFFLTNYSGITDNAVLIVEIYGGNALATMEYTGVRLYEGNVGLCTTSANSPSDEYQKSKRWYYRKKVTIPSGVGNFVHGLDVPMKPLAGAVLVATISVDGGGVVTGTVDSSGEFASFNLTTGNTAVRTGTILVRPNF